MVIASIVMTAVLIDAVLMFIACIVMITVLIYVHVVMASIAMMCEAVNISSLALTLMANISYYGKFEHLSVQ